MVHWGQGHVILLDSVSPEFIQRPKITSLSVLTIAVSMYDQYRSGAVQRAVLVFTSLPFTVTP